MAFGIKLMILFDSLYIMKHTIIHHIEHHIMSLFLVNPCHGYIFPSGSELFEDVLVNNYW